MFLSCNVHVSEWIQVVSLALGFRRTYNWPEIYIFHFVLRKFIENTNKKVCTIFFTNINISFFSPCVVISFQSLPKKVNQIRNNVVCVVAHLVFVFCCALTTGCCIAFQNIFVNQKKSEFYGPHFQTILFLVTMIWMFYVVRWVFHLILFYEEFHLIYQRCFAWLLWWCWYILHEIVAMNPFEFHFK